MYPVQVPHAGLHGWERAIVEHTRRHWSAWQRQLLIMVTLALAATCMVLAWIYHLKHRLGFWQAFGVSIGFVLVEFLLNTWITRYAVASQDFLPGQLAMISIVSGVLVLAILLLTIFRPSRVRPVLDGTIVLGFVLVVTGAVLLLRHQPF